MATPYVSGAVALLVSASKRMLTISEIRRLLLGGADKCSDDNSCCGYGYLNIDAALGRVLDLTGHEYLIKENVFSEQEDDQNINYSSKVENFHPLQIKGSAISDSRFIGKMLNNSEHADGHNELNEILVDETEAQREQIYTDFVTASRDGSNIIKIVDDYIALSQGNIPHSDLLNHVLSEIGALNIPDTRDLNFRRYSQLFSNGNLTPEMIYNIFTLPQYRYSKARYHDIFEIVARPGTKISGKLNSGDLLIRKMDTNYCHLAFIVSPQVMTFGDLVRNNFTAERRSNQKEGYVHVVEGKPRHTVIDRFARVICDSYGVVPDSQMVIRIKFGETRYPSFNLYDSLSYAEPARVDATVRQPIKQFLDDDLLESMNMFIESEKRPIVNPIYANKQDSFFLRIYRRKLESTDIDLVESQILANMSSLFPKIVEHVWSNLGKYPQRTHAKKFFAAGLVDQKFQSSRKKFRATKDKTTAQVVRELLMEGKIVVRSKEEDIDTIELKIEQELLGAQVHYNAAVTSFLNTMSTELTDPPNLNAIMAINLSNTIKEFDVFQAKSVSEFASSKLTQIISKEIIGQTLGKIPVFGTIINTFTDLAFTMIEAKEKAKKEYASKLEEYRRKQQRVYLSDFINNLLKSDTEKYEKFVKEFLKNLRRGYDAALDRIQIKIEQDKLRYDFVEIYYDLLDRAESLNKNTKLYELEFYLSWIKAVGLSPAERGLQIAISDPIKKLGFADFSPRAFITGLYSRNVAKGLKDVLRSQNMNVLDLKIQKKVYFLAVRHSDKDFQEVLRLSVSASGPLTFWITEQNHIFFPKINQLNRVQADEFFKLLSPEILDVLKATAEIDKGTETGFSFDNAFKKIEMDWNPAIWSGITFVEDARLIFGKPKGLFEEFDSPEIGEDVPDSKEIDSMINAALSEKVKLDPNVLTDPMKLKKLEADLTDFVFLKVTLSKKNQPVNADDRKTKNWSLMKEHYVKPAIVNYKKQREEENRKRIERQKFEAANTPTLDLGVVVARSLKVMKDKSLISIYNKNNKAKLDPHAIDVLTCILTKAQDPNLRGYISWNDYSLYTTEISGGGLTSLGADRLKAAGILDQAGKWNKYGFVQDFLRKPYYFDNSKNDMYYLNSLSTLYLDILWVINHIVQDKGTGGDTTRRMIVSLGDFILQEEKNEHSVYQCFVP